MFFIWDTVYLPHQSHADQGLFVFPAPSPEIPTLCQAEHEKGHPSIETLCLGNTFTVPSVKPESWQGSVSVPGHCPFQNGNWQIGEEGSTSLRSELCGAWELPLSFPLLNSTTNMLADLVSAQAGVPRGDLANLEDGCPKILSVCTSHADNPSYSTCRVQ